MRTLFRRCVFLLCAAAGVGGALFFPHAGAFLVREDAFTEADVALILSGLPLSRTFAARDLYRDGRVREIWAIPEPLNKIEGEMVKDQVKEDLVKYGLFDPRRPQWAEQILVAAGVPKPHIRMLPTSANGTFAEARLVREWIRGRPSTTLVLITSKSASRRARMIFRHVLKQEPVRIVAYPTPYDPFEPVGWWTQPRAALSVVMEYEKLIANCLAIAIGNE